MRDLKVWLPKFQDRTEKFAAMGHMKRPMALLWYILIKAFYRSDFNKFLC